MAVISVQLVFPTWFCPQINIVRHAKLETMLCQRFYFIAGINYSELYAACNFRNFWTAIEPKVRLYATPNPALLCRPKRAINRNFLR